jgi:hypothetical protein
MSYDGEPDTIDSTVLYRTHYDPRDDTELGTSILLALDAGTEYDVEQSNSAVFEYIDLEALDALFSPEPGTQRRGRVTFPVDQYEVTVTAAGEITIRTNSI